MSYLAMLNTKLRESFSKGDTTTTRQLSESWRISRQAARKVLKTLCEGNMIELVSRKKGYTYKLK